MLDRFPSVAAEPTDVLKVIPMFMADTFTFYLGDDVLINPFVTSGSVCEQDVIKTIGKAAHLRLRAPPTFVLVYQKKNADVIPGFERSFAIPSHRFFPDGSRPELNRHSFYREVGSGLIVLYRRVVR